MPPLQTDLRDQLRKAITAARREGEAGARRALEALAVPKAKPHESMGAEGRKLRNRLRAHGRQLGDVRDDNTSEQSITRLVHEVAYEHWHRMLFARFLAENGLLIEPESDVAITLDECEELAREQGEDPHEMAARFAQSALPQIFRVGDPVLELKLAPETRQSLEQLLDDLPQEVFTADDSPGWTYQFWQTEKKDEVNASGVKIGADELPAVTQLFTEHYMVQFLFHNTVGAWHAGKVLAANPELVGSAGSEEELRRAVRLRAQGGYDFEYLRFVREPREADEDDNPTGPWRPAASVFEGWPKTAKEIKVLDPCCGSGHFLVEGFELLVRLRMDEEGLGLEDAIRAVLADNLHGLEIDQRCTQIAAFNLALTAWKLAAVPIALPPLNIACSGLAPNASKEEWLALAEEAAKAGGMPADRDLYGVEDSLLSARLKVDLADLFDLFEKAPVLGSLIDPSASKGRLYQDDFELLQPLLGAALADDAVEKTEQAVAARGMARATEILSGTYDLAITNVPYLGRGEQHEMLADFIDEDYSESRGNLATVFGSRILRFLGEYGTSATVTLQSWLFATTYEKLRVELLRSRTWILLARLGSGAFETIKGEVVNVALPIISASMPAEDAEFAVINANPAKTPIAKAAVLRGDHLANSAETRQGRQAQLLAQATQLKNPGATIGVDNPARTSLLVNVAPAYQGTSTGDNDALLLRFWELPDHNEQWHWFQSPPPATAPSSGRTFKIRDQAFRENSPSTVRGRNAWARDGVAVARVGRQFATLYTGEYFSNTVPVLIPQDEAHLEAVWCYCESGSLEHDLKTLFDTFNIDNGYFGKVNFDVAHWQKVAAERYPKGLPEPQSDDPTQWLFHGHLAKAEPAAALQVAVARLLGYRWPPELETEMRLAEEARAWVERCSELERYADRDGIACLAPLRGERSAADRLRALLAAAFGAAWSGAKERELLTVAAGVGKAAKSLEGWLRDRFFEEHCKLFHHRPFVWHLWDGRADGFNCLVNAHRLTGPDGEGRRTLEALTYSYLGDWVERQRAEQREGREGADGRLAAALDLQAQLEKILEGEPPYDLFVRWKPLHEQPIGWAPDINDGIRLNIRPFMSAELRTGGRKGAGILRWKPNINWGPKADRGKDPESLRPKTDFPWFWSCPGNGTPDERTDFPGGATFDGNRWNDLHYTNATKRAARERALKGAKP